MTYLLGFVLIYGVPALLAALFWLSPWFIRRLIAAWTGRDVMLSFIPAALDVAHTERLLGIRTRITRNRT